MRIVTTCHKAGWDQYGRHWLEGLKHWPEGHEFILYAEGFDLEHPRVECRRIDMMDRANQFKAQYSHYTPSAWRWDIVKWCNKVFAAHDALYDYDGIALWMDADCITRKDIPAGYIEHLLPDGTYWAGFTRIGWQTETGFWLMDCKHPEHRRFMDAWIKWLEDGWFKDLAQWCDASTLDATLRVFVRQNLLETHSLSAGHDKHEHPMSQVPLAEYIEHLKGSLKDKLNEEREAADASEV